MTEVRYCCENQGNDLVEELPPKNSGAVHKNQVARMVKNVKEMLTKKGFVSPWHFGSGE